MNITSLSKSRELLSKDNWLTRRWKAESFSLLRLFFKNRNYHTFVDKSMFLPFQLDIEQKYRHVTSHWITWLNVKKSKAKWFLCPCVTCFKIWSYLFWFFDYSFNKKERFHLLPSNKTLPKKIFFTWVKGPKLSQIV